MRLKESKYAKVYLRHVSTTKKESTFNLPTKKKREYLRHVSAPRLNRRVRVLLTDLDKDVTRGTAHL